MASKVRQLVRMVSENGDGHFYTTSINPRTAEGKLERRKYNPKARKHMLYKQAKIK